MAQHLVRAVLTLLAWVFGMLIFDAALLARPYAVN
jgi:hypothetical protein